MLIYPPPGNGIVAVGSSSGVSLGVEVGVTLVGEGLGVFVFVGRGVGVRVIVGSRVSVGV